jgi:cytoskeletal protein CcmA (bactofilin family)
MRAAAGIVLVGLTLALPAAAAPKFRFGPPPPQREVDFGDMRFRSGLRFTVDVGQTFTGDTYILTDTSEVSGTLQGDLIGISNSLVIDGSVTGDLNFMGGEINLKGMVGDDVRALTGNYFQSGSITGDLLVLSATADLSSTTHIAGGAIFKTPRLSLGGRVDGPVRIEAAYVELKGQINGDVRISCDQLKIEPNARINGNLYYSARQESEIPDGVVAGTIELLPENELPDDEDPEDSLNPLGFTFRHVYLPVVALITGIFLVLFFGRFVGSALHHAETANGFGMSFGIGFVAVIASVMVSIVCICLFPLSLAIWSALGALIYFGGLIGKMAVGHWVLRPLLKRSVHPILGLVVGVVLLELLSFIPWLGTLTLLVAMITGIGAVLMQLRSTRQGEDILPDVQVGVVALSEKDRKDLGL